MSQNINNNRINPKVKNPIKKINSSKMNFPKQEKEKEKEKEEEKTIESPGEESSSQNNSKKLKSLPSQAELDKKDSELNLNENSLSSEDKIKKDSFSNNNEINEKMSEETTTQREKAQKPFNKNGLLSKCHLKLATYIEQNKDVTLAGTKRFTDKSGEYYLKNVQLRKKKGQEGALTKTLSLKNPQTLENCFSKLNGNLNKIKKNAT